MRAERVIALIEKHIEEGRVLSQRRVVVTTDKRRYKDALRVLKEQDIQHITAITGVDLGEEIEIIYHIDCGDGTILNLELKLPKREARVSTVTDIFPGAILYERELMEMLGVKVTDHPDPERLFLPDDWPGDKYPLLEGQFNYRKIAEKTISEIKEASKERDFDYEMLLEAEKRNKNRKSLKKWLERQIKRSESEKE